MTNTVSSGSELDRFEKQDSLEAKLEWILKTNAWNVGKAIKVMEDLLYVCPTCGHGRLYRDEGIRQTAEIILSRLRSFTLDTRKQLLEVLGKERRENETTN